MAPPPLTKSGTRKLSEVARKLVIPSGIVSTGWPAVRDTCQKKLGVSFDQWQDGAGRLTLAKRADGKLASMIGGVGMSLCRQCGKTYLVGSMIFALCILMPGLLVIWSAHHSKTHAETFLWFQDFAKRLRVAPYVSAVYTGSGDEEVRFHNGSRILFGAREHGFGRGIPGVDVIVDDEAQIMSDKAVDAQLATVNTSKFGLVLYLGTPPRPDDPSEAFTRMRSDAWAGTLLDAAWIELGAEPGVDPHDRQAWARANPSFPHRTPVESMLRLQRKLKPDSFLREGLGIWDEGLSAGVFGQGAWLARKASKPDCSLTWLGIGVAVDQVSACIVGAGKAGDRLVVKPLAYGPGVDWVPTVADSLRVKHGASAVIAGAQNSPGNVLVPALKKSFGRRLHKATAGEAMDAFDGMVLAVKTATLSHAGYPELDRAVQSAVGRKVGDRRVMDRRKSGGDISPLEAANLAVWALDNVKPKQTPPPDIF